MIIDPAMLLVDSRGVVWRAADNYQERDTTVPGWLALASDRGERETFSVVVESWGFRTKVGVATPPYLVVGQESR